MYLYGNTCLPNLEDNFLYHFTKADSLIKILENMTLKMSSFQNLNDLNEKEVNFTFADWREGLAIKKYIVDNCQLLSFSKNFKINKELRTCECGCNHPRMWAQYADNNKGACLVINEDKFKEKNKNILNKIFYKFDDVCYKPYIYNGKLKNSEIPEDFLKENYKEIFFTKHLDWIQEDERRLFCINGAEYLSINECIEFICLGNKFEEKYYDELIRILISNFNLTPHDFVFQVNEDGRCICYDNAHRIIEHIKSKGNKTLTYIQYLNNIGYKIKL